MRCFVAVLIGAVMSAPVALAQQAAQTPEQQAMVNKLMQEISVGLQCQAALITAQKELDELRKKPDASPPK